MAQDDSQERGEPSGSDEPSARSCPVRSPSPRPIPPLRLLPSNRRTGRHNPDSTVCIETTQAHEPSPLYLSGVRAVTFRDQPPGDGGQQGARGQSHDDGNEGSERGRDRSRQHGEAQDGGNEGGRDQGHDKGSQEGQSSKKKKSDDEGGDNGHGNEQARSQGQDRNTSGSRQQDDEGQHDRDDRRGRSQSRQQPSMTKNLLVTAGIALVAGVIGALGYSYMVGSKSDQVVVRPVAEQGRLELEGGF